MKAFYSTCLRHTAFVILFGFGANQAFAQCNIGLEGASPSHPAACANQTTTFGSGAYRDIDILANTYYVFTWNDNGAPNLSGFCAAPQNGGGSDGIFSTNQGAWFSGSTTVLRVSANRTSSTWASVSAQLDYRRADPSITANSPTSQTICAGQSLNIAGGAATSGTRYWQGATNNGTSVATASSPNSTGIIPSQGAYTFYYRPSNGGSAGCWGNQQATVVTVDPLPVASATPNTQSFCSGASTSIALSSSVGGTTYAWTASGTSGVGGFSSGSGSPIAQTLTNSSTAPGTATYTITPTAATCIGNDITAVITVNPIPDVIATPSSQAICSGSLTSIALTSGVSNTTFSWTAAGTAGTGGFSDASGNSITQVLTNSTGLPGTVTYTITPTANGCPGSAIIVSVTVNPLPAVSFSSLGGPYCINQTSPVSLVGLGIPTTPPGTGVFSGTGVSGTDFVPSQAAVGTNTLTYTYTDVNTCVNTAQQTVQVTGLPLVSFSGLGTSYCINNSTAVPLVGFPVGGTFSGNGISGSNFTPSVAGVGLHSITYTYSDVNGCVNTQSQSVNVFDLPVVGIFGLNATYCVSDLPVTISGFPVGGTFSGTGISGNQFSPTAATVGGPYTISYLYTDGNSCSNSATTQVSVNGITTANAGVGGDACAFDFQLAALPSVGTGTWSQTTGIGTSSFSPNASSPNAVATVSAYGTYTFTWTEVNGACSSASQVTVSYYESPIANSGNGGAECDLDFVLSAVPTSGSGMWSQVSGPGFITFLNSAIATTTATASQSGVYTLEWTETNGSCTSSDQISIAFESQPISNAGLDDDACDLNYVLSATSSFGTGLWTQISGSGNASFSDDTSPTSTVTVDAYGTYVFQWEESNGNCGDAASVTINFFEQPTADAGFGAFECDLEFNLSAIPSLGVGTWTSSGPGTASFSPNENDPNAVVTVSLLGTYDFTWTEINGSCTDDDVVNVTFQQQTSANAGVGGSECDDTFTFNGTPSSGIGSWSHVGPGTAYYINVASANTSVIVDTYGTYDFTWSETNGTCITSNQITVNFYEQPIANAGQSGDACSLNYTFDAVASVGLGSWTQLSGPGTSSYDDSALATATVTVDQFGTYSFEWSEVNGNCSDSQIVSVNFYEQPVANAGNGGNECDLDFDLAATPSVGLGEWTQTSGPGTSTFASSTSSSTSVSVDVFGTYEYTWTETNGTCSDNASITVNYFEQPIANAGLEGNACELEFNLNAIASVGLGQWALNTGAGTAAFSNSTLPSATVVVSQFGTYDFTWTETNGTCSDAATVTVNFWNQPTADAGIGGDACDLDFDLAANPSLGSGEWTQTSGPGIASFGSATSASTLVTVDAFGTYSFTWTETNNICVSSAVVTVNFFELPTVDAGLGGVECDLNFDLNAVSNSGNGVWAISAGNGFANFSPNAADPNASVTVSQYGSYTFTWTENNGTCSASADVVVDFFQQPVANAGVAANQCDLDGELSAVPSVGTGTWTYSGPGTAVFTPDDNTATATVTVTAYGTYDFTWTEINGGCTDADAVTVTFNPLPVVDFSGLAASYCVDQTTPVQLTGTPSGGTFSGVGISGNLFIPSIAGVSTQDITYTYTDSNGCTNSETQSVDVNAIPVVSFTGLSAEYCVDETTPSVLVGTPSGGTFSGAGISGNDFEANAAGVGTHIITYTFTDPLGCTGSTTQTVVVNPLPVVSFTGLNSAYCEDIVAITLTGTPAGGTFSGLGITGNTFSPSDAGTGTHDITYSYTDANGCSNSSTQSVVVNALPLPVISPAGPIALCEGSSVTLDAGAGYALYNWSNGGTNQTITVSIEDDYTVTVTSAAGCSATSTAIQVSVLTSPVVNLGEDATVCAGSFLTLNAGNPGATYSWSTLETTQQITIGLAATYSVEVTSGNGCVGTDEIVVALSTVQQPVISANGSVSFCEGQSVELSAAPGFIYAWSTGETSQNITVSEESSVQVTIENQFGCTAVSNVVNVIVSPAPSVVIVANGSTNLCEGNSVTLTATGSAGTYSWSPTNETTSAISADEAGLYTVTVTDAVSGCSATSSPTTVNVNVSTEPTIVVNGPLEFCEGGSVTLSVEPAGAFNTFLWNNGPSTGSILVTESGTYAIQVIDLNNCLNSVTLSNPIVVTVWNPTPEVVQNGGVLQVINGPFATYQWFRNGSPLPGAVAGSLSPDLSGNYTVQVTDANGCSGISSNIEFTFVGIGENNSPYSLNIYPNPSNGQFSIEAELGGNTDVILIVKDVLGRQLMQPERIEGASSFRRSFDISHLTNGVYYVQIVGGEGFTVKSIVKN
jgi:hypothetical protein